jgi:Na+-driven multidrug efflux pump
VFSFSSFIADIYGQSFLGLGNVISIAVFTVVFTSLSNVYTQAYLSKGKNWIMLFLRLIRDLGIFITAYFYLANNFNSKGALILVWSSLIWNVIFFILIAATYEFFLKKKQSI